jgi:hypothetical protein
MRARMNDSKVFNMKKLKISCRLYSIREESLDTLKMIAIKEI